MGPVLLIIEAGSPMSPGGVLKAELSDSDPVSSCLWGCAVCICKFLWTTQIHPSPCHGLIVYTGRFSSHSITLYLVFSQLSPFCFSP